MDAEAQADFAEILELGTSTFSEAAGLPCALDSGLRPIWKGAGFVGPAYPIRCAPGDNLALHLGLEQAPRGSVLVVDAGGDPSGYWGEVFTVAAEVRGILGLVIDGSVRDIDALERRGFPVFARGVSMRGTIKQSAPLMGERMVLSGISIAPGDLVVADADGVLCLPADAVAPTLAAARARQAKEADFMRQLAKGQTTVELLGLTAFRKPAF